MARGKDKPKPRPEFLKDTMTLAAWAKSIGVSLPKAYDWRNEGLPTMKWGRERIVHVPTAEAWLMAKLTGARPSTDVPRDEREEAS
jgi:hypothetical protein